MSRKPSLTERQWRASKDPERLLAFLGTRCDSRKRRLFACACCRRIWNWIEGTPAATAVEVAERFADGLLGVGVAEFVFFLHEEVDFDDRAESIQPVDRDAVKHPFAGIVADLPRAVEVNKQFHFAVYQAAKSPTLNGIIRALWLKVGPVINLDLRANPERIHTGGAVRFHAEILDAIVGRDAEKARAGIAADIKGASDFILSRGNLPDESEEN